MNQTNNPVLLSASEQHLPEISASGKTML